MAQPPPDPPSRLFIENLLKKIYVWGLDAPPSAGPSHLHPARPLSLSLSLSLSLLDKTEKLEVVLTNIKQNIQRFIEKR